MEYVYEPGVTSSKHGSRLGDRFIRTVLLGIVSVLLVIGAAGAVEWTPPVTLVSASPYPGACPMGSTSLGIDSSGNWHLVYDDDGGYVNYIRQGWSSPLTIAHSEPGIAVGASSLAIDNADGVHIAWQHADRLMGPRSIRYLAPGSPVVDLVAMDPYLGASPLGSTSLAIDGSGNWHLVYNDSSHYVKYTRQGWSSPVTIEQGLSDSAVGASSLAIDQDGGVHIAWQHADRFMGPRSIRYLAPGSSAVDLVAMNPYLGANPMGSTSLAIDSGANWHLAYDDDGDYVNYIRQGSSSPVPIAQGNDFPTNHTAVGASSLAVDQAGAMHVAWQYAEIPPGFEPGEPRSIWYTKKVPDTYVLCLGVRADADNWVHRGDLGAEHVCDAFAARPGVKTAVAANVTGNKAAISGWVNHMKTRVQPGDSFVFYINCHGFYDHHYDAGAGEWVATPGDEPQVMAVPCWDNDVPMRVASTGDEHFYLGSGQSISDDEFSALFLDPVWQQVDKLFIVDTCYAGGFWGNIGGLDSGDLGRLERTAILAACTEDNISLGLGDTSSKWGKLGQVLVKTLEGLDPGKIISFEDLADAVDLNGTTFGGDVGYIQGMEEGWDDPRTVPWFLYTDTSDNFSFELCTTIPGDANWDNKIDGADLAAWQQNYDPLGLNGDNNTWAMGDWNDDDKIDGGDLSLWQQNYDPLGPAGAAEFLTGDVTGVPEPASVVLLALGAAAFFIRRRRHARV